MDYDTLKEQWSDVEERDGIRLSWNTFPSSRMVQYLSRLLIIMLTLDFRKHPGLSSQSVLYTHHSKSEKAPRYCLMNL